jgi:hypothetical protein
MKKLLRVVTISALIIAAAAFATVRAQDSESGHRHTAQMNERGDRVMGFSHEKTTHHFYLTGNGGIIRVAANDPNDAVSRNEIREHLAHIAKMFAGGDFRDPMLIHAQVPPGALDMKKLAPQINYKFEETADGGRVYISTADPQAVTAIHKFLRFQIREHHTGDPLSKTTRP